MTTEKTLADLQAGDEVIVNDIWRRIVKIDRVTATLIIIGNIKYRRKDGRRIGISWYESPLQLPTPANLQMLADEQREVEYSRSYNQFIQTMWSQLPRETILALIKTLAECQAKEKL